MNFFARCVVSICTAGSLLSANAARGQSIKPPAKSTIDVGLRFPQPKVSKVEDLLVSLSVTNKSGAPVKMLFDIPYRRDFGPWMTRCIIRNSRGDTVQRHQNKQVIERKEWTPVEMESFRFVLRSQDYRLRLYALTDLAILDEKKLDPKTGRLPPGRYTVQVFFYDIPSDIVSFELRDPPPTPKAKPGMTSSSPK